METTVKQALANAPNGSAERIKGISIDTTGSTPVPVNQQGVPLSLTPGFEENPNAMFVLWKDHTGVQEAEEITGVALLLASEASSYMTGQVVYSDGGVLLLGAI